MTLGTYVTDGRRPYLFICRITNGCLVQISLGVLERVALSVLCRLYSFNVSGRRMSCLVLESFL